MHKKVLKETLIDEMPEEFNKRLLKYKEVRGFNQ